MEKERIIFSLIKSNLFDCDYPDVSGISPSQWEEIHLELREQTVSGVPAEWIFSHADLTDDMYKRWTNQYIHQVAQFYKLICEQNELVQLMSKNNIPMAIIKGAAAAIYYPDPSARAMGDIDFLVSESDFYRAYKLMLENGYELKYDEDNVDYHITLEKNKFIFEIHKEPAGMPNGSTKKYLQQLIEDGINSAETIRIEEYDIPILPRLQNGIVFLLHIVKHLKGGLGLRQIIDWMMYVNKELHDEEWNSNMQPILANVGYEQLAKIVTRVCQIYLGLRQDTITWCADVDEHICEKLMNYIMEQGNFGYKVFEEDKGVKILEEVDNPIQFFVLLQKRGEDNWEYLQKHPWARPFAWIYMSCRYIHKAFKRKSPIRKMVTDIQGGNERKELFDDLGLYQQR